MIRPVHGRQDSSNGGVTSMRKARGMPRIQTGNIARLYPCQVPVDECLFKHSSTGTFGLKNALQATLLFNDLWAMTCG